MIDVLEANEKRQPKLGKNKIVIPPWNALRHEII